MYFLFIHLNTIIINSLHVSINDIFPFKKIYFSSQNSFSEKNDIHIFSLIPGLKKVTRFSCLLLHLISCDMTCSVVFGNSTVHHENMEKEKLNNVLILFWIEFWSHGPSERSKAPPKDPWTMLREPLFWYNLNSPWNGKKGGKWERYKGKGNANNTWRCETSEQVSIQEVKSQAGT